MKWYVVQVMTGKEEKIKRYLQEQGIRAIVPKRIMRERKNGRWHEQERIIFPSYIFLYTNMDVESYYKIKPAPGVIKILGDDRGPQAIRQEEVNYILRLSMEGDPIGLSKIFMEGSKISVLAGPLKGLEGKILKVDARRFRAKVDINFMGEPRVVELAVDVIKKSES